MLEVWAHERKLGLIACRSGHEALEALVRDHQSVLVMVSDQRMPGMRGTELLAKVHELYPDIVTMLLTGRAELAEVAQAVQSGIFSFLLKPCERPTWNRSWTRPCKCARFGTTTGVSCR